MAEIQKAAGNIEDFLTARYFINPELKECSKNYRVMLNRCFEKTLPKNEKNEARFVELCLSIEPATLIRFYYSRIFGGYKKVA